MKTLQESILLLEAHKKQGVNYVCLTPHFYSDNISIEEFLQDRKNSINELSSHLPIDIKICVGAEVFVTNFLFNNSDLSQLCYGGKNYMLTEFPYSSKFSGNSYNSLVRLINNYGITPVIAHIERYPAIMKNKQLRDDLLDMGVMFQTNANSILKFNFKRHLLSMIKDGTISFLGTDCHSFERNIPTDFAKALELIEQKLGAEVVEKISDASQKVFSS